MNKLALLVSMYDEFEAVCTTLANTEFDYIGVVQSGASNKSKVRAAIEEHGPKVYNLEHVPDLADQYSKWELPARALCRNFSMLFQQLHEWVKDPGICEYAIVITGDTRLLHLGGIDRIIACMQAKGVGLGVSKAVGVDFHGADLTLEELQRGQGGGREQSMDVPDFQPQLWIVRVDLIEKGYFQDIKVTNRWCSEQCLGDATMREDWHLVQYVFDQKAYGFCGSEVGVFYHAK